MRGMRTSNKTSLIIIALTLLVCFVALRSRRDAPVPASVVDMSQGTSFEVRVVMPRSGLPLFGILPDSLLKKFDFTPRELGFDHTSRGARIGRVGPDRLELKADSWDLVIETDFEGKVAPDTRLVFPLALGGRQVRLNCRPADGASGYFSTTRRTGSDELDGRFLLELATCKNAESGKAIDWPPAPLTVRGSFAGLLPVRR